MSRIMSRFQDVANDVLRDDVRGGDIRQRDVAFGGNVGADETAADVCHADVAAPCFDVDRRIRGNLDFEVDIADVAAAAIVAHHINHQTIVDLARLDVSVLRFDRGGKTNLILVPRLDDDRAGDVTQFDANVLAAGIAFGYLLLSVYREAGGE